METDFGVFKRNYKASLSISAIGMIIPFGMGAAVSVGVYNNFIAETTNFGTFLLFVGVAKYVLRLSCACALADNVSCQRHYRLPCTRSHPHGTRAPQRSRWCHCSRGRRWKRCRVSTSNSGTSLKIFRAHLSPATAAGSCSRSPLPSSMRHQVCSSCTSCSRP